MLLSKVTARMEVSSSPLLETSPMQSETSAEPSETQKRKQIIDAAAEVGVTGGLLLALMGVPDVSKEV